MSVSVVALAASRTIASSFQFDPAADQRAQAGKAQLEALLAVPDAERSCHAAAVSRLEGGCSELDDDRHRRLAIQFTNCHLERSGVTPFECEPHMSIAECTAPMYGDSNAFGAYTTFYTHTESMCFYLQSKEFQSTTERLVNALRDGAADAALRLGDLQEAAAAQAGMAAAQALEIEAVSERIRDGRSAVDDAFSGERTPFLPYVAPHSSQIPQMSFCFSLSLAIKRDTSTLEGKQRQLLGGGPTPNPTHPVPHA